MSAHVAQRSTSGRKATKAIAAGAVAVALLAAGGGSFASWYDDEVISGGTISSGTLALEAAGGAWTDTAGNVVDLATYQMIPGSVLTYTDTITITAEGNGLTGELRTNLPELTADADAAELLAALDVTLTVGTVANTGGVVVVDDAVTPGIYDEPVDVTVTVAFPMDSATLTAAQAQQVALADMQIVLEQSAPTAA
ncbi:alternate-type signal peptide domain-containing protein [Georgenia faecalis]|uniref:Alternate-type signal peptide domain-containing protein n=1 Tax=Georgenia faecalis TaxID=2483799 RepID=A0ABV9D6A1_9MICO|nr:alternate-type signal peptide domain-containing protein [Georgenia faecalis]